MRDVDRIPGVVFDESERSGAVKVRRRDGRTYTITADEPPRRVMKLPKDFRSRIQKICPKRMPQEMAAELDKLIAGE